MKWFFVCLLLFMLTGCSKQQGPNKFSDEGFITIHNLKDRRSTDSLLAWLKVKDPVYRREAALAFASVQDTTASETLGNLLLEDEDWEVRRNAAFALGQTGGYQAVNALIPALRDPEKKVVREALEALGKSINSNDVEALTLFQPTDSLLQEGLAWAFYRLALRNKSDSIVTQRIAEFLAPQYSYLTRLAAANYFARSQKIKGTGFSGALIKSATTDPRPEVRMVAISGFRHIPFEKAVPVLTEIIKSEKDWRVRVSAVRVCQNYPLTETRGVVFVSLKNDSSESVGIAASEVIRNQAAKYPHKAFEEMALEKRNPRITANLYAAVLKSLAPDKTVTRIIESITSEPYSKSHFISALGEATDMIQGKQAFQFIKEALLNPKNEKVVQSTAAVALVRLDGGVKSGISKKEFLEVYKQAISVGDAAVTGIVCSALSDSTLQYKPLITDLTFLYDARSKLSLPKDIESIEPLNEAIAYLEGKPKPEPSKNQYNHPIPWKLVKSIPADQQVEIKTVKGTIVVRLFVEEDPGSVANFVELVNKKYFDNRFFHRVVPNFVIQDGCNRGDGYGSEDYSIRSEFSIRRYTTGSVGMASAGKDTEGTQWFITHSPTPHLDGRYSLFGEVISGMNVVDQIEVGDEIVSIKLMEMTHD